MAKYGDEHGLEWHVHECEGHGMYYEVSYSGDFGPAAHRITGAVVGLALDTREQAESIVETFRAVWGGTYTFHSIEDWYAELGEEGAV